MSARYSLVANRAAHRCEYFHAPEAIFNLPFEVQHIVPPSRGGRTLDVNPALSCRSSNLFKTDHVEVCDPESLETVRLFNPGSDEWDDHFRASIVTGETVGLTPTGRETVLRLRMNSNVQCAARIQWHRLGLFS